MIRVFRSSLAPAALPVLLIAAACSGNAVTPPSTSNALASAASHTSTASQSASMQSSTSYIYGCTGLPKCRVFTSDGQLVRTIVNDIDMPGGIAVDPAGNVYVTREFAHEIGVYSPGMSQRIQTLDDGTDVPLDVAVHNGVVAVSDQKAVTVFASGTTSNPSRMTDPNILQGNGIAFDSKGNCYWSFAPNSGSGRSLVDEFTNCAGSPQPLTLAGSPGSLAFDGNDNLYYASDTFDAKAGIYKCTGVTNCKRIFEKEHDPFFIRFDSGWKNLFTQFVHGHAITQIDVATGKVVQNISRGFTNYLPPVGIAAGPGPG